MTTMPFTLQFLGAAGTVTGSKYLLTIRERRILVDAGMFQGEKEWRERNWEALPVDASSISDIVLTHAHADHSAYLPAVVRAGFSGAIWCTEPTRRLAEIVLRDSGKLQEMAARDANAGGYSKHSPALPVYTIADVEATLPLFRSVDFDTDVDLGQGLVARYVRAGHILGSASVTLTIDGSGVVFSGDIGRHDHPILRPRERPVWAPYVCVESTYGDREHPEPPVAHEQTAAAIRRTIGRGGTVVMPAFAIDRIETVVKALSEMLAAGRIPDVPVYVDGPMALAALDVYRSTPDEIRPDVDVRDFTRLPHLREARTGEQSRAINGDKRPKVIIATSGMCEGGRVLFHLSRYLPDPKCCVVLTGYQAGGTRGRALEDGEKQVKINGKYVAVRAEIVRDHEYSVHGDASDLMDWVRDLGREPATVFVTHGEPPVAELFAQRIRDELGWVAVVPRFREVVSLADGGPAEVEDPGIDTGLPAVGTGPDGE